MQQIRELQKENQELSAQKNVLTLNLKKISGKFADTSEQLTDTNEKLAVSDAKQKLLEAEVDVLMMRITQLTRQLAAATDTSEQLALQIELKRVQTLLSERNQTLFGSKSERRPSGKEPTKKVKKKQTGHGPRKQPKLSRNVQIHLLDDADQICPDCGAKLVEWQNHCDESEEITVVQRKYEVTVHKRQKYKCSGNHCSHIDVALGDPRFFPGNRYSTDFVIEVAIDKYCDHLPLNRQVGRMRRAGLIVTTATLWDQLKALSVLFLPTLLALHEQILQSPLLYADETTWRMMKKGGSKKWWVWVAHSDAGVYYLITSTRSAAAGRQLLQEYDGIVMADDYTVYNGLAKLKTRNGGTQMLLMPDGTEVIQPTPDFILVTCWAHIRRYFYKAEKGGELGASEALDRIDELYGVEREAKGDGLNMAEVLSRRRQLRGEKSADILAELDRWRHRVSADEGTRLSTAVKHLNRVWEKAVLFVTNPLIPLDNNTGERDMRKIVLGRRNHQGSRSEDGAQVSALFYSLVVTCEILGLNPAQYLRVATAELLANPKTPFLPTDFKARIEADEASARS